MLKLDMVRQYDTLILIGKHSVWSDKNWIGSEINLLRLFSTKKTAFTKLHSHFLKFFLEK